MDLCHHNVEYPVGAGGEGDLHVQRVAAKIFDDGSRTIGKDTPPIWVVGRYLKTPYFKRSFECWGEMDINSREQSLS